jgi:hypothetical protein
MGRGQACAPRFAALQQTWREEEDGTHIVLLHSVDHPAAHAPPPVPGLWLHPVPCTVRPSPSRCIVHWQQGWQGTLPAWRASVRACGSSGLHGPCSAGRQVLAAGFTIAPLQPRFTGGGASGECLVTLVLKVNDLGGWLSAPPLGALLAPWLRRVLAEAAAGAVIALRDKARRPGAPPGRRRGARHGAQRVGCRSARACGTPRGS